MAVLQLCALPHVPTLRKATTCAYTQRIVKACKMFMDAGHEVYLYSGAENDALCTEHIACGAPMKYDPKEMPRWGTQAEFEAFNADVIMELSRRIEKEDLVLISGGHPNSPIADFTKMVGKGIAVEWGVGYEGVFAPFICFESHAWRHYVYGLKGWGDGRWFDTVIPNFFDPKDFPKQKVDSYDEEYLLYVGRVTQRKGVGVAADIARETGLKLIVCGPGVTQQSEGLIVGDGVRIEGDVHYYGVLNAKERATMMSGALALLAPTIYIEPFGGVVVEAMLSSCPPITSDWGAFTENVPPEFRFRTLAEGVECVEAARTADRKALRENALGRFSLEAVAPQYTRWFERLLSLWGAGWYSLGNESQEIRTSDTSSSRALLGKGTEAG